MNTPILLIVFNRPEKTKQVFEAIKQQKPKQLFIAADGPRLNNELDRVKCAETRDIIKQIDWPCDIKTLFRTENRGCGYGPAEAITWFFDHVEEGIILEDDCLVTPSFFQFCDNMLHYYRDNDNVSMISGSNFLEEYKYDTQSYVISKLGLTWGWATWKKSWELFNHDLDSWDKYRFQIESFIKNPSLMKHLEEEFNIYSDPTRKQDVWDFQWLFARLYHHQYSIVPTANLVSNIGFDHEANHTFNESNVLSKIKIRPLKLPIKYQKFKVDKYFDWLLFERVMNPLKKNLFKRLILKIVTSIY